MTFSILAAGLGPLAGGAGAATEIDLGTLGGRESRALAVSSAGQVVGWWKTSSGVQRAFSWTKAGGMVDLGTLGGEWSLANGVNAAGQVIGESGTSNGSSDGFLWTQATGMVDLGTFGGNSSFTSAINDAGEIAGCATPPAGSGQAFLWTQAEGMTNLGFGSFSCANAINDAGQVVGTTSGAPFLWSKAHGTVMMAAEGTAGEPVAINASGQAVGTYTHTTPRPAEHPFSWTEAGGFIDLGTIGSQPNGHFGWARAVNDSGEVVGMSSAPEGGEYGTNLAFLWTPEHGMVSLGALEKGELSEALAISDAGQVVGWSAISHSHHGFSWTESAGMLDLGGVFAYNEALAVNNSGQVVGWEELGLGPGGGKHAVVWYTSPSETASSPLIEDLPFHDWVFSGTLSERRRGQAIILPAGSTFNGSGELNLRARTGSMSGALSIPPFTDTLRLFGSIPLSLGVAFSQVGAVEGSLVPTGKERPEAEELLTAPLALKTSISSLGLFGLTFPVACATSEPLRLELTAELTRRELLRGGDFSGQTTMPSFACGSTPLGHLAGFLLTALLSGPKDPYSVGITAPAP